jgi:hypothetical protein
MVSIDHFIQIRRRQSNGRRVYIRPPIDKVVLLKSVRSCWEAGGRSGRS